MQFFKKTQIEKYSAAADAAFKEAVEVARNRREVSRTEERLTRGVASRDLYAVNHKARVIWGKSVSAEIANFFCRKGGIDHDQPVYLVTLVHADCVTKISDTSPDISGFKAYLRYGLRGYSYFGAIEPAFYSNVQVGIGARASERKCIFWHIHVLLWGVTDIECKELVKRLNRSGRYQPIVQGLKGAHRKLIVQGDLPAVVGYMFKPPGLGYRLWQTSWLKYDRLATRLHQYTSPLRPGERINLFCAMSGLYLDGLALAGGDGEPLLAAAKTRALNVSGYARMTSNEKSRKRRRSGRRR